MQLKHKNEIDGLNEKIGNLQIQSDSWEKGHNELFKNSQKDVDKLKETNKKDRAIAQDLQKQIEELEEFSRNKERDLTQSHKTEILRLEEASWSRERKIGQENQKQIQRLEDAYKAKQRTLTQDYNRELQRLEEVNNANEHRYEILEAEKQQLEIENQSLYQEQTRLNNANAVLNNQQDQSITEISRLKEQSKRRKDKIESLTQTLITTKTDMESLGRDLDKAKEDCSFHRNDAAQLRAHIAKAESQQSPLRDEDFYIQNFGEIKTEIESWIARNAKTNAAQSLSDRQEINLLQSIAELGEHGQKASKYLRANNRVQTWYSTPRWRIPLARHIVAAFIFAHIFQPFVVGLPTSSSEVLEWIDNDIMSRGSPLKIYADP